MPTPIVETRNLTYRYGDFLAVKDLSFHIEPGEVFGLLGPNGAGKSTTISMLTCLLPPTSGSAAVAGLDVARSAAEVKRLIEQSSGLTILIVLILAIASGAMSPNIAVPGLQWLTPHFWAIRGFQNIITREMGLSGALQPAAVLTGMALLCFALAVWRFRFED